MIRLTVHAAAELERIERDKAPGEINMYDCRNCRANKELLVALQDETPLSPMQDFSRWRAADGRELCFVPLISQPAQRLLAQEADAREYGWHSLSDKPNRARRGMAFRIIRSERAVIQREQMKPKDKDGPRGRIQKG
jgi:hypothetical protein